MAEKTATERLVGALNALALVELAKRAERFEFHDYKSPHAMPKHALVKALHHEARMTTTRTHREQINKLAERVVTTNDFSESREEAREWQESPEGLAVMDRLRNGL